MINVVNVGYDSTNYYVLAHTSPALLIDVGFPQTLPKLQHTAKRAGIDLARIPFFLCTHYHPDHAGAAEEVQRLGIRLVILELQLEAAAGLGTYMKPDQHFVPIAVGNALRLAISDSRAFLRGLGLEGEIVYTPGHSDDSMTLVLDDGAAFTGDLPPPFLAGEEPDDPVRRSWDVIRAAHATMVYPGHGPSMPLR